MDKQRIEDLSRDIQLEADRLLDNYDPPHRDMIERIRGWAFDIEMEAGR